MFLKEQTAILMLQLKDSILCFKPLSNMQRLNFWFPTLKSEENACRIVFSEHISDSVYNYTPEEHKLVLA